MDHSYYLTFKQKKRQSELIFNVGSEDKTTALLRLRGRTTKSIFDKIISSLSRAGCVTPIESGDTKKYWVRDDVGPVLGTYLILIRQSTNPDYWLSFFDELLTGKYSKLGSMFSCILESAIDLSRYTPRKSKRQAFILSPAITSSLSPALKVFIKTLKKRES